jgi:glycosyltransferase involved in cell wall biosynthesis
MKDLLISVVIPVYKVEDLLRRCVDSVLAQTHTCLEVILVDDGSPDNSGAICDEYAAKDDRVIAIHKQNGGAADARNVGLNICHGDYIAFADSDDWIEPNMYEKLLALCLETRADIACCGRYDVNAETMRQTIGLCPSKAEVISAQEMLGRCFTWNNCDFSACDKLFKRSLWENTRFPVGKTCEDVAAVYRVISNASSIALCPQSYYYYYHRAGSVTMSSFSEKVFHFSEYTAEILPEVECKYPEILDQALVFRLKSITYPMARICVLPRSERDKYWERYKEFKRELKNYSRAWKKSSLLSCKEKIYYMILQHPFLYRIYRKFKD